MFIISDNKRRKTSFGCAFNSSSRACLVNNSSAHCESFLSPDAEGGASAAAASSGDLGTTEAEASTGWRGNCLTAARGVLETPP